MNDSPSIFIGVKSKPLLPSSTVDSDHIDCI
jgi:hypothetical protein